MGLALQELLAFVCVAAAASGLGLTFFRTRLAAPIARMLLARGHVAWAMWMREQSAPIRKVRARAKVQSAHCC